VQINEENKGAPEEIEEIKEAVVKTNGESMKVNRNWVETNEEFPMNYYVMESVGFEQLNNFFKGLVPMLRNLKKAHYELKAKLNHFIKITEVELAREFAGALGIRNQLTIEISELVNLKSFNRNFKKLQEASKIADETHNLFETTQCDVENTLRCISPYRDIHPIATKAKENRQFTPSQIILRYWPDQSRVLGKVHQSILRLNLIPPPADEMPRPKARIDEESKQVASEENFTCLICFDLAEDVVELSCCSTIMCEKCSIKLNSICPNCRKNFVAKPSIPIRRIIGKYPWRCTCGHSTTRSEMKSHLESCPERILSCKFKACTFAGVKANLKVHVDSVHAEDILAEYY
jgi:hypothetical protein